VTAVAAALAVLEPGKIVALVFAAVFAILTVRSAIHWMRHRPPLRDTPDELLFAAFVTGRVGTWAVAAAMFFAFGTISTIGQAYADEAKGFWWLFLVFIGLGAVQFLAAAFLALRDRAHRPPSREDRPNEG
jgi:hypothetical protein